jgi:malate/lactate dehydrogenase
MVLLEVNAPKAEGEAMDLEHTEPFGIFKQTRDAAHHIIERKDATYCALAARLMRIVLI